MPTDKKTIESKFSFEKTMKHLETLVERMEKGEQTLESSLADYEKGVELIKQCHAFLENAEQRITILQPETGSDHTNSVE